MAIPPEKLSQLIDGHEVPNPALFNSSSVTQNGGEPHLEEMNIFDSEKSSELSRIGSNMFSPEIEDYKHSRNQFRGSYSQVAPKSFIC